MKNISGKSAYKVINVQLQVFEATQVIYTRLNFTNCKNKFSYQHIII